MTLSSDFPVALANAGAPIGDLQVAYTSGGSGEVAVLIHGLAESRQSWRRQQQILPDVRTYAYDLRGHGDTTIGTPDGTLTQLGGDLIGFLEQVSGPAALVGFSLGGAVALWTAAHRPDLVRRVVVLGTSSVVGRAAAGFYAQRIAEAADVTSLEFRESLRADTAAALAVAVDRLDEVLAARLAAVGDGAGYRNAAAAMAALHSEPLTPTLTAVTTHVDVVGGASDAFCPIKAAQIMLDVLPDASYHEIPRAGHLMGVDCPEDVAQMLHSTLTGRN